MRVRSMNPFTEPPPRTQHSAGAASQPQVLPRQNTQKFDIKKLVSEFKADDYILIGIIAVLFFEGCEDYILLAALGYLFVMGIL